jgi:Ca-activated chloride channel family protein
MEQWFSPSWFGWNTLKLFHWVHPYFLYAIPFIPFLFVIRNVLNRRSRQLLVLSSEAKEISGDWIIYLRYLMPFLMGLSIALILIALARPQIVSEKTARFSEGLDIMLLIDVSDSMLERDLHPNRLEAAKRVAGEFINSRVNDRIGLVVFAGEAFSICPLTNDYDLLKGYLQEINPKMINTAGTAIGSAIAVAINRMRDTEGNSKVIILISDGDNTSGNLDPETTARLARAYGITIYTTAVGQIQQPVVTDTLGLAPLYTANISDLKSIAESGGGQYFVANNMESLQSVFSSINTLEKVQFKDIFSREVKDYYQVYLHWAIVFLLLAFISKSTFISNMLED